MPLLKGSRRTPPRAQHNPEGVVQSLCQPEPVEHTNNRLWFSREGILSLHVSRHHGSTSQCWKLHQEILILHKINKLGPWLNIYWGRQ